MRQYLLHIYQPDGPPPTSDVLETIMAELATLNQDMKAAGAWVFSRGLFPPTTSTVAKMANGEVLLTDGPYLEGKEHLGGIMIISAPDLDAALEWGARLARVTTLPIEIRPFHDDAGG